MAVGYAFITILIIMAFKNACALNDKYFNDSTKFISGCKLDKDQFRYEVLPGMGWDNLLNAETGRVLEPSYSNCVLSEDGKYLVPDALILVPIKTSEVNLASEIFHKFTSYSTMTANSINIGADLSIGSFGISGSFSSESKYVRKSQYDTKSSVSRVQLRYQLYSAKFQIDSTLHPVFRNRVLDIAGELVKGKNPQYAEYLCDLLVRDFGTHVTTQTVAGALISKFDFIKSDSESESQENTVKTSFSASASFASILNIKSSGSHTNSEESQNQFEESVMNSRILSHGGPVYGANFSLELWEKDLANNLVAIDRQGDPLHYVITTAAFPELKHENVYNSGMLVKEAIKRYYSANSVTGCTDLNSDNFNPLANVDSGDCKSARKNFTLGGVYQTCKSEKGELCSGLSQKNPLTGDFSCSVGYQTVKIVAGNGPNDQTRHCKFFDWFCHTETTTSEYEGFWCSPIYGQNPSIGYLLGGVYTSTAVNPVTNDKSCPRYYIQLKLGHDLHICVSYDIELGINSSLPFAGFYSCLAGNPLALHFGSGDNSNSPAGQLLMSSVYRSELMIAPKEWPKECPTGYSRHVAAMDNACQVSYCIQANAFSLLAEITIRRPPFIQLDNMKIQWNEEGEDTTVTGQDGKQWVRSAGGNWIASDAKSSNPWMIAAVTIIIGFACLAVFVGGRFLRKRHLRRTADIRGYRNMPEVLDIDNAEINSQPNVSYGTTEDTAAIRQTRITVPEEV